MKRSLILIYGCALLTVLVQYLPESPEYRIASAVCLLALGGWWAHGLAKDIKAMRSGHQQELAKEKIRELEKELGFEPINFQELTDDEVNRMYEDLKKEKDA